MIILGLAGTMIGCTPKQPATEEPTPKEEFKFLVDQFADLRIMRYQLHDWDQLSLQQKAYIYYDFLCGVKIAFVASDIDQSIFIQVLELIFVVANQFFHRIT